MESIKGSKLYSIAQQKCPVCQEGDYFTVKNPYSKKTFSNQITHCEQCGHKFEIENGFFYGAMYVSYGISVAIGVSIFMALYVLWPSLPYYYSIFFIIAGIIVFMPIPFRLSRMVWMNLFAGYGKKEIFNK